MEDFDAWYREEYPKVLAACTALAGGRADVGRDATDEAFTRAIERWHSVRGMQAPGGWVQVVALNQLRRSFRRQRTERHALGRASAPAAVAPDAPGPDRAVWAAVGRLPRRQRACIVLRYVHDLAEADIAASLGVTRGTVSATLHRALERLRADLGEPVLVPETGSMPEPVRPASSLSPSESVSPCEGVSPSEAVPSTETLPSPEEVQR